MYINPSWIRFPIKINLDTNPGSCQTPNLIHIIISMEIRIWTRMKIRERIRILSNVCSVLTWWIRVAHALCLVLGYVLIAHSVLKQYVVTKYNSFVRNNYYKRRVWVVNKPGFLLQFKSPAVRRKRGSLTIQRRAGPSALVSSPTTRHIRQINHYSSDRN